jgi:hypothetical protein
MFYDVNRDSHITSFDVLAVVNRLNARRNATAEAESAIPRAFNDPLAAAEAEIPVEQSANSSALGIAASELAVRSRGSEEAVSRSRAGISPDRDGSADSIDRTRLRPAVPWTVAAATRSRAERHLAVPSEFDDLLDELAGDSPLGSDLERAFADWR